MQILSGNRFRLGLGAGENLNEHVVGKRWPAVGVRHAMLAEAIDIIGALFDGRARQLPRPPLRRGGRQLWDLPDARVPIGIAVSGEDSCRLAGDQGRPDDRRRAERAGEMFDAAGGAGKPRVGQIAVPTTPTATRGPAARPRAVPLVRAGLEGQRRPPEPGVLRGATQFVTPEQVAAATRLWTRCRGARQKIRPFIDAGSPRSRSSRSAPSSRTRSSTGPSAQLLPVGVMREATPGQDGIGGALSLRDPRCRRDARRRPTTSTRSRGIEPSRARSRAADLAHPPSAVGVGGDQLTRPDGRGKSSVGWAGDPFRPERSATPADDRRGRAGRGARRAVRDLRDRAHDEVVLASSADQAEVEHYVDLLDARGLADGWTSSTMWMPPSPSRTSWTPPWSARERPPRTR